ncbi:calcium uptake protein, mitochondrial-like isoform X2 [Aristolochia californica]|uniref:calcium uptake protein, mitochondrial-like isoform X2 n=1 Tax=Aristolochia californica TaxID=171875 RepID=UPI0035DB394C
MCALLSSLKRSSSSLARNSHIRLFSNLPRSSSSSLFEEPTQCEDSTKGRLLLRALSGVVVASGVGVCLWASSSSTFADSVEVVEAIQPKQEAKKTRYLFADSYRRRVFFNYEKRIRTQSSPEKVFEYFASHRASDGEVFMTPADLMRAIVPVFPPSESNIVREGYLRGERRPGDLNCAPSSFFMLFDTNNDGLISFPEYIFFVTLLSIPETSFSVAFKMFDLDHNGKIALEEFKKVMALMRSFNRQGARHKNGKRHGLKVQKSVESGGLLEYFFGKDGDGNLQHEKFVQFLKDLHNEILRLEFSHYDYKSRGTISAKDFALSMVASADMNHINRFLDRVDELPADPHFREVQITFEEFKAFAELRKRLKPLALAIFGYGKVNGLLTKEDFRRAVSHVCGIVLTDNVVDVVFHVFDSNNDGSISSEEFLHVLQKRQRDMAHPVGSGFAAVFSCWLNCAKSCSIPQMLY